MAAVQAAESMRELKWSTAEKAIARRAFESALRTELDGVIRKTKRRAARIEQSDEVWELEEYLKQRRIEIDGLSDYRYSVLPAVFGRLLREGRLKEGDLDGLGEDKLTLIRRVREAF